MIPAATNQTVAPYHDFMLELRLHGMGADESGLPFYEARLLRNSPGYDIEPQKLVLSLTPNKVEDFFRWVNYQRIQAQTSGVAASETGQAEEIGRALFDFIFKNDELREKYRAAQQEAMQSGSKLRLILKLDDPKLQNLPWEYLCEFKNNESSFLFLGQKQALVRYLGQNQAKTAPGKPVPLLQVLVLVGADPKLQEEWYKEVRSLEEALVAAGQQVKFEIPVPMGWEALQTWLLGRKNRFQVIHYLGHGKFDPERKEGYLLFNDGMGKEQPVFARDLQLLFDDQPLKLVLLNACYSARSSQQDRFSSVAARLNLNNTAVIAMLYSVVNRTAIKFSRHFYYALAQGLCVEEALSYARKVVYLSPNRVEFGLPVFYSRSDSALQLLEEVTLPALVEPPMGERLVELEDLLEESKDLLSYVREQLLRTLPGEDNLERWQQMRDNLEKAQVRLEEQKEELNKTVGVVESKPAVVAQRAETKTTTQGRSQFTSSANWAYRLWDYPKLLKEGQKLYEENKQLELARQYFARAIEKMPKKAEGYLWLGKVQLLSDEVEAALGNFEKAKELSPGLVDAYVGLANAYANQDKFEDMLEVLNEAIRLDPEHVDARWVRAELYYNSGNLDEAIDDFRVILGKRPEDPELLWSLAGCYYEKEPPDKRQAYELYTSYCSLMGNQSGEKVEQALARLNELNQGS